MNKIINRFASVIVALALTLGVFFNSHASSASTLNEYNLIFQDNFDTLNPVWHHGHFWSHDTELSTTNTNEQQAYAPGNVSIENGNLKITAVKQTVTLVNKWPTRPSTYYYTSGLVETGGDDWGYANKFSFQYGHVEARIKIPAGQGMWPAFWLWPVARQDPPEIDIMEILGNKPQETNMTIHYAGGNTGFVYNGVDLSKDFHVYGCDWTSTYIAWSLDGIEVARFTDAARIPQEPMYLILNLAVGGNWPGPVSDSVLPTSMLVDWVKVYQLTGGTTTTVMSGSSTTIAPLSAPLAGLPSGPTTAPLPALPAASGSTNVLTLSMPQTPSPASTAQTDVVAVATTQLQSASPVALPATLAPSTAAHYDDKNQSLAYSSGWKNIVDAKAYQKSYKRASAGSSVTMTFTGQSFSIIFTSGPKLGSLDVYVDGALAATIDENSSRVRYQQRWDYAGQLTSGTHTLRLVSGGTRKSSGTLDAVIVQ